ncbi:hypothetical protein [Aureimonas glaciei]|uniref:Uncharacterized protein n=1 Tax=Aureimonas glaciei TaxID=1776957 RepID=A0A916XU74_9HYPH|nr:hypothetical protein [Aureimonas glaciei]GGD12243.1 hypothetical protein GCM10011335_13920 [Aureimonas glaciei]
MDETGSDALEAALRAAVARHRRQLQREADQRTEAFERRFLLARLGFPPCDLDAAAAVPAAAALPPELRRRIEQRLTTEAERLLRLARAGSARYDLNRHIAVHRSLGWLQGRPPQRHDRPGDDRQPGRAVNAQFRRPGRPRRRTPRSGPGEHAAS